MVLEDVNLKLDAFDYLELPVAVTGGCVQRLEVQVGRAFSLNCNLGHLQGCESLLLIGHCKLDNQLQLSCGDPSKLLCKPSALLCCTLKHFTHR